MKKRKKHKQITDITTGTLILASKSRSREKLLKASGLSINAIASRLDEDVIKKEMFSNGAVFKEVTERLAIEKARLVSKAHIDDMVIGADQMLVCEGRSFDKAKSIEQAVEHLKFFRGKPHKLITSVALVKNEKRIWTYTSEPTLTMRDFSDQFLDNYIQNADDALLHSVGAYFLEDIGITLFSKIEGDYYDILGMPLLPLLDKLRDLKIIDD